VTLTRTARALLATVTALGAAPAFAGELPALRVTIDTGVLEGVAEANGAAFKGIPYAAAPTGEWRWKPPRPAVAWTGVRAAHERGPACPQPERFPAIRRRIATLLGGDPSRVPPADPTSEDCLSLNVFTANLRGGPPQPVMVWLHGGGFTIGSGEEEAATLAPLGAVVVTLNYRLGLLGFLAHPALTAESPQHASGNYGLLDQIEALRWVRRNIAAFGGDPGRVTVFGHSSGGEAVLYLMASPLARGLFQRGVAQSSSGGATQPLAKAEEAGLAMAARLGVPAADPLPALRAVPTDRLVAEAPSGFDGVQDGWVLPDLVPAALARAPAADIPLLIGATSNEFSVMALVFPPPKDREAYRRLLRETARDDAGVERLLALYPAATDADVRASAIRYIGDVNFVCPSRAVAAKRRGRTWAYRVSVPPVPGAPGVEYGAFHGSDLRLLFLTEMGVPLRGAALAASGAMRRYWIRFAATGDPNDGKLPRWPAYERGAPRVLDFGETVRSVPGFGGAGCDALDGMM
jgi:para-nitrobenzyl esterase